MFQNTIISEELSIYKFFNQLNFDFYLTNPQLKHLENIMNVAFDKFLTMRSKQRKELLKVMQSARKKG